MANSVDLVIGSEAIKQVESLISKLSLADAELLKISQSASNASKGISGISTPSGLDKAVQSTASLNTQLEKQNTIITKLHADIAKKAEQSRLAEIRLQQAREKAFDSFEKNAQKEQAIANKNASAYNKTQSQINTLTKAYNDLAVRKERYNNLTANEEMRLQTLSRVNEKYNGILKATDATIGKNQRNVGNYASGYNALGNSINQLSREAPAFANSVNTGFMALSNNFPALFDAINGIRDKNKMLVAEGKPTVSVLKSIAGAIFSWQTLLSVGVTLLTLYGGKIIDYAFGLNEAQKAQKALKDEMLSAQNTITSEITQLQSLTSIVLDNTQKENDRIRAYEEIKKTLPGLTSATYEQAISTGELTRVTDLYISSLIQKNVVEAEAKSIADSQTALNKTLATSTKERIGWFGRLGLAMSSDEKASLKAIKNIKDAEDKASQDAIDRRKKDLVANQEAFLKTQQQLKPYTDKTEATKNSNIVLDENIQLTTNSEKAISANINAMKEQLSNMDKTSDAYQLLNSLIKLTEASTKMLGQSRKDIFIKPIIEDTSGEIVPPISQNQEDQSAWLKQYKIDQDDFLEKQKEVQNYLKSFSSEFMANSGFSETFDMLNGDIEGFGENFAATFNAIAESAQEAFNFISNASQQNFDAERQRIEDQQKIAISYAGGSEVAIAKINEDAEKRKKDIANRENKVKQKQAIFNIAIDTAQAIIATLAKTPPPAGLPLAFLMGALGAAQIAMVASQKIPQYFDGTDNHIGGMMLVNDGAGSNYQEKVILPNGKEIMPEGRNVLMNAPKGTKVLTHEQQIMQMLNERGISMSAKYNQSNGATAQEIDNVMSKHFSKIQTNNTTFDKNGFRSWSEKNGNRTIQNNNRVSRTGFKI